MSVIIKEPGYKKCFIDSQEVNGLDLFNNKIFNNDKVKFINNMISLESSNRSNFIIGGVLKLISTVQYTTKNSKKPIYEFIPLNWKYPKFLVPSDIKNNCIKRNDKLTDYFVVIKFKEWIDKYPVGYIERSIGPITSIENMYEILLYYYPETPYLPNKLKISEDINIIPYNISSVENIYSIDPIGCKDIDDALSFDNINNKIGIHIADVNYTIQNMNIVLNKFSTIYAPHKVINMIPDELAYNQCSLLANHVRPVISCYIDIDTLEFNFKREFIIVKKNYMSWSGRVCLSRKRFE